MLPTGILLVGTVTSVAFWHALTQHDASDFRERLRLRAREMAAQVEAQAGEVTRAETRMAARWEAGGHPLERLWVKDASMIAAHHPGVVGIGWADPSGVLRWLAPETGLEAARRWSLKQEPRRRRAVEMALGQRRLAISEPVDLVTGGVGFLMIVPLFPSGKLDGFITVAMSVPSLMEAAIRQTESDELLVEAWVGERRVYFNGTDTPPSPEAAESEASARVGEVTWRIRVAADQTYLSRRQSDLPQGILFVGLLVTVLLAAAVGLSQMAGKRAVELAALNRKHEEEIEARKAAQAALAAKARELARSNADLEHFAFVASHELLYPAKEIQTYAGLLDERMASSSAEVERRYVGIMRVGASRMVTLVNDLLAYARVGRRNVTLEAVDLAKVVGQVLSALEGARQTGATVTVEGLPTVTANPTGMSQLLQNLIGNALKFRGPKPPLVRIFSKRGVGEWQVSVEDNGIGIDPEHAERVFALFQRVPNRSDYPGTGIGLAIARKVVEWHGGRIWVESRSGEGATFHFTIPDREADAIRS